MYCLAPGVLTIPAAGIPVECLKSLLVHREKCLVAMPLTREEWCVVLSGLKDTNKLKELCVYMREVEVRATDMNSESDEMTMMCFHIRTTPSVVLSMVNLMSVSFPLLNWRK